MNCKLCNKDKRLVKSHIIPKSFIKFMYPKGKIEGDSLEMVTEKEEYTKKRRAGIYDYNILCQECDNWIGREYDEYGKKVFIDSSLETKAHKSDFTVMSWRDVDANKVKLFILSVFWRYVVSRDAEDFKTVNLPIDYSNKLRKMIIDSNAGSVEDFSIIITQYKNKIDRLFQIPEKTRVRSDGSNWWILYFPNGFKIFIKVDKRKLEDEIFPVVIQHNKPIYCLKFENYKETRECKKLLDNIHKFK